MNDQIDITVNKICSTCQTKTPLLHHHSGLITLGEHTRVEIRIEPDEFLLCATCNNSLYLQIQAQPYELVNHLDTPVARSMYEQQLRDRENTY